MGEVEELLLLDTFVGGVLADADAAEPEDEPEECEPNDVSLLIAALLSSLVVE